MDKDVENLAQEIVLLAEWLAINDNKTRLQSGEYMEEAQDLADWLYTIGYRLTGKG